MEVSSIMVTPFRANRWLSGCLLLAALGGCNSSDGISSPAPSPTASGAFPPILDGGGGIPDAPNGVSLCPKGACNYQSQSGCVVEAGLGDVLLPEASAEAATPAACQPFPDEEGGIVPTCAAAGTLGLHQSCKQWTECQPGLLCVSGTCKRLCCGGDYTACSNGEHCFSPLLIQVGDAALPSEVMVCMPVGDCNVFTGAPCTKEHACHIIDPTGAVACVTAGSGKVGDPCPCAQGFLCVKDACRRLCKAVEGGGDPYCPEKEGRCIHYDRHPLGVGECVPDT